MKTVSSVGIVVFKDNKVLLVREGEKSDHLTGVYNTPAGRIESDETPIQAAVRELLEESGLIATEKDLFELPKKYAPAIKRKNGETIRFYHTVFYCKRFEGELKQGEDVTPLWMRLDEVSKLKLLPNIEDMIKQAQIFKQV